MNGSSSRSLDGKLAIVTGGSRGIGAAIVEHLASKGATIVLNYTSDSSAEASTKLSSELEEQYGVSCLVVQADMGSPTGPEHIVATAKNHFSHPKTCKFQIDIIVNNAGVAPNDKIADFKISDFDWCYRVNVLGPLLLVKAAQDYLPHDRSGRIVNLSSVSSSMGFIGQSVYGGTKAALESMTRTWARELSERATVNAINPGPVASDMWFGNSEEFMTNIKPYIQTSPLLRIRPEVDDKVLVDGADAAGGRPAYPSEIAGVVGMLCSQDSAWVTGQVVSANGGMRFGN